MKFIYSLTKTQKGIWIPKANKQFSKVVRETYTPSNSKNIFYKENLDGFRGKKVLKSFFDLL